MIKLKNKKTNKSYWLIMIIIALILIDQAIKHIVVSNIYKSDITIIKGFFSLTYVENYGVAYGMGANKLIIFIILNIIIIGALISYLIIKLNKINNIQKISMSLIIAGGIGNLTDRIIKGYVIDYLDFNEIIRFPVFNFADICITIGCILLIISIIVNEFKVEKK